MTLAMTDAPTQPDHLSATHRAPGGIYGFTGFGSPISVSIDSDGTVTATMADDPQTEIDRRALAVLADDDTLWWADRAVAGINEAFEVMPLTDDEGIGEVVTELMTTAAQVEHARRYGNGAPPPTSMSGPSPRVGILLLHAPHETARILGARWLSVWTPTADHLSRTTDDANLAAALAGCTSAPIPHPVHTNPHAAVRAAAASSVDDRAADILASDPEVAVRVATAANPQLSDASILLLAQDRDRRVRSAVRARPNATTEAAAHLFFGEGAREIESKISAARAAFMVPEDPRPLGWVEHNEVRYLFAASEPRPRVVHLAPADDQGNQPSLPPAEFDGQMRLTKIGKTLTGRWAPKTLCGHTWAWAIPDRTFDGSGGRICRSCIKQLTQK